MSVKTLYLQHTIGSCDAFDSFNQSIFTLQEFIIGSCRIDNKGERFRDCQPTINLYHVSLTIAESSLNNKTIYLAISYVERFTESHNLARHQSASLIMK